MTERRWDDPAAVASAEAVRRYEDERYHHFDQKLIDWAERGVIFSLLQHATRHSIRPPGAVRVLDAPSGYGRFTERLLDRWAGTVAVDLSYAMVERTRDRVGGRGHHCVADLRALPFGDGAFHYVLVIRLLQHLDKPARAAALAEVARVTSGWAIVSAYTPTALHTTMRRLQRRPPKGAPLPELLGEFRAAGLDVVRSRVVLPALHAQRIFLATRRGTRAVQSRGDVGERR